MESVTNTLATGSALLGLLKRSGAILASLSRGGVRMRDDAAESLDLSLKETYELAVDLRRIHDDIEVGVDVGYSEEEFFASVKEERHAKS